jgi:PKD repeat protein
MNVSLKYKRIMAVLIVCIGILAFTPVMVAAVTSSDSVTITGYILQPASPVADFIATPTSGTPPLMVQFTDLSTGSPTGWQWDFENDGKIDSTVRNPSNIYKKPGIYSVKLRVTNTFGSSTKIKTGYIAVASADPGQRIAALMVYVNNLPTTEWSKWLLTVPLRNAERSYEKGNEHAAVVQMRSFVSTVQLIRWFGLISQGQANYMIAEANAIIALIQV